MAITKLYEDLDSWIPTLTPGTYDLTIDFANTSDLNTVFTMTDELKTSPLGKKLQAASSDIFFSLSFVNTTPDFTEVFDPFNNVRSIKSIVTPPEFSSIINSRGFFGGMENLETVDVSGLTNAKSLFQMFANDINLTSIKGISALSNVEGDAKWAFMATLKLTSLEDYSIFSKITDAEQMFYQSALSEFINVDFSGLINAPFMFQQSKVTKVEGCNFSNLVTGKGLFFTCTDLVSVDASTFGKVTDALAMFGRSENITTISNPDFSSVENAKNMFDGNMKLTSMDCTTLKKATNTDSLFNNCVKLAEVISPVFPLTTDTSFMFGNCQALTSLPGLSVPKTTKAFGMFNTSGITSIDCSDFGECLDAGSMFSSCKALTTVENANFQKATNIGAMFTFCPELTTVTNPNFSSATNSSGMFQGDTKLQSFDCNTFTNVTASKGMFVGCSGLKSITNPNFPKTKDAWRMFDGCGALSSITGTTDFSSCENAEKMFYQCRGFDMAGTQFLDCSTFGKVKNAKYMFSYCFIPEFRNPDFSSVVDGQGMFSFALGLSSLDTSTFTSLVNARQMFYGNGRLETMDTSAFGNVEDGYEMFRNNWIQHIDMKGFKKLKNADEMFIETPKLVTVNLNGLENVESAQMMFKSLRDSSLATVENLGAMKKLKNAVNMFSGCTALSSIDLSGLVSLEDGAFMFEGCTNLSNITLNTSLDSLVSAEQMFSGTGITSFPFEMAEKFRAVEAAQGMFENCKSLYTAAVSPMGRVTKANNMFKGCNALTNITDWIYMPEALSTEGMFQDCSLLTRAGASQTITKSENTSNMFSGCTSLVDINILSAPASTNAAGMFYNCSSLISVDTIPLVVVTEATGMFEGCTSLNDISFGPSTFSSMNAFKDAPIKTAKIKAPGAETLKNEIIAASGTTGFPQSGVTWTIEGFTLFQFIRVG